MSTRQFSLDYPQEIEMTRDSDWGGDIQGPMRNEEMAGFEDDMFGGEEDMHDYDRRCRIEEARVRQELDRVSDKYKYTRIEQLDAKGLKDLKGEGGWDSVHKMLEPLDMTYVLLIAKAWRDKGNQLYETIPEGSIEFRFNGLRILGMSEPTKILWRLQGWLAPDGSTYAEWNSFLG